MPRAIIDIETRSVADLRRVGTYVYARDATTAITHVGWKNGIGDAQVWQPARSPIPNSLADALADERIMLVAHNSMFERLVLSGPAGQAIGLPSGLDALERWNCTAARAGAIGLPRALMGACTALNLPIQKDVEGNALMRRVSRPRTLTPIVTWWEDAERVDRLAAYCLRDVNAEAELDRVLPQLTESEHAVWMCTERLNDRGIAIDPELLPRLISLAADMRADLNEQIKRLTGGAVPRVTDHGALTRWLVSQGLEISGTSKDIIAELLEEPDLPEATRAVLELRQAGGGSSAQKAAAISSQISDDGRVHGALVYAGAPATGRWSSLGPQLHNLPRHNPEFNPRWLMRDINAGATLAELAELHGRPLKIVSELLRPLLVAAPGATLVWGDYSQIEARVLCWLAGQDDRLGVFRAFDAGTGPDAYKITAARIYRVTPDEVTPAQRQVGKVADLALGYQGGHKAFRSMAKNFAMKISSKQADEVKFAWRDAHPQIVDFWKALNAAAMDCLAHPGLTITVGKVDFRCTKDRAMTVGLPSGRRLVYWRPSIKLAETPWKEMQLQPHYWGQDALTRLWTEFSAYGGLFAENITQATARDLLADALVLLDAQGLSPLLTVHDEIFAETDDIEAVAYLMKLSPAWAAGLLIAVDVGTGPRYLKV